MGLLQKLSESGQDVVQKPIPAPDKKIIQKKSNTVGLLKKSLNATKAEPQDRLDFFEFIKDHSIPYAQLFVKEKDHYYSKYSYGLDGKSIISSISTFDFWDGLLPEKYKLYTFKTQDNSISPLYQFFSDNIKDKINLICLYKCKDDSIFLFCNYPAEQDFIQTAFIDALFNQQQNGKSTQIFELDFSEAIDSYIIANHKNNYKDILFTSLSNAIRKRLDIAFDQEACIKTLCDGKFTLFISSKDFIPFELISNHLRLDCSYILDQHAQLITVEEKKAD